MKKEQKFEARLEELGLTQDWENQGRLGKVATTDDNGNIILLVHEACDDNFSEIHYPPFQVLRQNYQFVKACILEWKDYDGEFEKRLDDWLAYGMCSETPCPLAPVDAYFPADSLKTYYHDFEDDPEVSLTREQSLLGETIQDITLSAWPIVWADNKYDQDSRVVLEMLRDWAVEFENWWLGHDQEWMDNNSYYIEVEHFAQQKAREYVMQFHPEDIVRFIKPGVSLYEVICHWTEDRGGEEYFALYDLEKVKDFNFFKDKFGEEGAVQFQEKSRYWFDGCYQPFDKTGPQPVTEKDLERTINVEVLDWICEQVEKGNSIDHWDQVFDLDKIRPYLR